MNMVNLLKNIIGKGRFSYPKSLYAVEDQLSFIVDKKPNALILDFFAGSGTTLHAVNLLNKEDGGHRRCIMVTSNDWLFKRKGADSSGGLNPVMKNGKNGNCPVTVNSLVLNAAF